MITNEDEFEQMLVSAGQHELAKRNDGDDQLLLSILAQTSPMIVRQRKLRLVRSALSYAALLLLGAGLGWLVSRTSIMPNTKGVIPMSPEIARKTEPSPTMHKDSVASDSADQVAANSALEQRKNVDSKNSAAGSDRQIAFSPQQLELQAELAETRSESARLYRSAGDAFLKQNNVKEAVRCYRLHLDSQANQLALADDDSWLLMSIKSGMKQGINQ